MVRRDSFELCERSSPTACARCFPERTSADFFLRQRYILSLFADVDRFIAPSRFLKERHVEWGLRDEAILVLENGQPEATHLPPRLLRPGEGRNRFAFFGQLNPFKGVDLLLRAVALLREELGDAFHLHVHGANLSVQDASFREEVSTLAAATKGVVSMHGEYEPRALDSLMSNIDWVVVPSIWWENSPMVIQEAYARGRPVIAADIGGMREKVDEGAGGLRFAARDARGLADVMRTAMTGTSLFDRACASLPRPLSLDAWVDAHLAVYGE
jgi:glycosyltransferase involved in cell wall biosynthesis